MTIAIKFENISKQYRLGEIGTGALSHDLHRAWARLRGKPDPFAKVGQVNHREIRSPKADKRPPGLRSRLSPFSTRNPSSDYVWALKDIDFGVEQGDIVGIIGRNGAGKSTLLKLLSRVTAPTSGSIKAKGRIASLLEVGTGFHPELTGRENVFLNGAILGMQRPEITKQLDAIVDFSGCGKFIDTPVKRYSSGMTVRLGFAVAAHLDCEILVVDEVLAVGDAQFQNACIGRMKTVSQDEGRTVLFVSHNMGAVAGLCTHAHELRHGELYYSGTAEEVVESHLSHSNTWSSEAMVDLSAGDRCDPARAVMRSVRFLSDSLEPKNCFTATEPIVIELELAPANTGPATHIGIGINNSMGERICSVATYLSDSSLPSIKDGATIRCKIPQLPVPPGQYPLSISVGRNPPYLDSIENVCALQIITSDFYGNGSMSDARWGRMLANSQWAIATNATDEHRVLTES